MAETKVQVKNKEGLVYTTQTVKTVNKDNPLINISSSDGKNLIEVRKNEQGIPSLIFSKNIFPDELNFDSILGKVNLSISPEEGIEINSKKGFITLNVKGKEENENYLFTVGPTSITLSYGDKKHVYRTEKNENGIYNSLNPTLSTEMLDILFSNNKLSPTPKIEDVAPFLFNQYLKEKNLENKNPLEISQDKYDFLSLTLPNSQTLTFVKYKNGTEEENYFFAGGKLLKMGELLYLKNNNNAAVLFQNMNTNSYYGIDLPLNKEGKLKEDKQLEFLKDMEEFLKVNKLEDAFDNDKVFNAEGKDSRKYSKMKLTKLKEISMEVEENQPDNTKKPPDEILKALEKIFGKIDKLEEKIKPKSPDEVLANLQVIIEKIDKLENSTGNYDQLLKEIQSNREFLSVITKVVQENKNGINDIDKRTKVFEEFIKNFKTNSLDNDVKNMLKTLNSSNEKIYDSISVLQELTKNGTKELKALYKEEIATVLKDIKNLQFEKPFDYREEFNKLNDTIVKSNLTSEQKLTNLIKNFDAKNDERYKFVIEQLKSMQSIKDDKVINEKLDKIFQRQIALEDFKSELASSLVTPFQKLEHQIEELKANSDPIKNEEILNQLKAMEKTDSTRYNFILSQIQQLQKPGEKLENSQELNDRLDEILYFTKLFKNPEQLESKLENISEKIDTLMTKEDMYQFAHSLKERLNDSDSFTYNTIQNVRNRIISELKNNFNFFDLPDYEINRLEKPDDQKDTEDKSKNKDDSEKNDKGNSKKPDDQKDTEDKSKNKDDSEKNGDSNDTGNTGDSDNSGNSGESDNSGNSSETDGQTKENNGESSEGNNNVDTETEEYRKPQKRPENKIQSKLVENTPKHKLTDNQGKALIGGGLFLAAGGILLPPPFNMIALIIGLLASLIAGPAIMANKDEWNKPINKFRRVYFSDLSNEELKFEQEKEKFLQAEGNHIDALAKQQELYQEMFTPENDFQSNMNEILNQYGFTSELNEENELSEQRALQSFYSYDNSFVRNSFTEEYKQIVENDSEILSLETSIASTNSQKKTIKQKRKIEELQEKLYTQREDFISKYFVKHINIVDGEKGKTGIDNKSLLIGKEREDVYQKLFGDRPSYAYISPEKTPDIQPAKKLEGEERKKFIESQQGFLKKIEKLNSQHTIIAESKHKEEVFIAGLNAFKMKRLFVDSRLTSEQRIDYVKLHADSITKRMLLSSSSKERNVYNFISLFPKNEQAAVIEVLKSSQEKIKKSQTKVKEIANDVYEIDAAKDNLQYVEKLASFINDEYKGWHRSEEANLNKTAKQLALASYATYHRALMNKYFDLQATNLAKKRASSSMTRTQLNAQITGEKLQSRGLVRLFTMMLDKNFQTQKIPHEKFNELEQELEKVGFYKAVANGQVSQTLEQSMDLTGQGIINFNGESFEEVAKRFVNSSSLDEKTKSRLLVLCKESEKEKRSVAYKNFCAKDGKKSYGTKIPEKLYLAATESVSSSDISNIITGLKKTKNENLSPDEKNSLKRIGINDVTKISSRVRSYFQSPSKYKEGEKQIKKIQQNFIAATLLYLNSPENVDAFGKNPGIATPDIEHLVSCLSNEESHFQLTDFTKLYFENAKSNALLQKEFSGESFTLEDCQQNYIQELKKIDEEKIYKSQVKNYVKEHFIGHGDDGFFKEIDESRDNKQIVEAIIKSSAGQEGTIKHQTFIDLLSPSGASTYISEETLNKVKECYNLKAKQQSGILTKTDVKSIIKSQKRKLERSKKSYLSAKAEGKPNTSCFVLYNSKQDSGKAKKKTEKKTSEPILKNSTSKPLRKAKEKAVQTFTRIKVNTKNALERNEIKLQASNAFEALLNKLDIDTDELQGEKAINEEIESLKQTNEYKQVKKALGSGIKLNKIKNKAQLVELLKKLKKKTKKRKQRYSANIEEAKDKQTSLIQSPHNNPEYGNKLNTKIGNKLETLQDKTVVAEEKLKSAQKPTEFATVLTQSEKEILKRRKKAAQSSEEKS